LEASFWGEDKVELVDVFILIDLDFDNPLVRWSESFLGEHKLEVADVAFILIDLDFDIPLVRCWSVLLSLLPLFPLFTLLALALVDCATDLDDLTLDRLLDLRSDVENDFDDITVDKLLLLLLGSLLGLLLLVLLPVVDTASDLNDLEDLSFVVEETERRLDDPGLGDLCDFLLL